MSNFYPDRIMDFLVTPAVNQIETHPFHQQVQIQRFHQEHGVQTEAWGPYAGGKNDLFQNETIHGIATAHGRSVAQVVPCWLTQRSVVAIPKSVRKERMAESFNVFDVEWCDEDMATLDNRQSAFFDHRDPAMVKSISTRKIHSP